jgi:predicted DNA-binding transcriptional regulator YafY
MSFEDQTARIEGLISLIGSTNSGTADELAERLGVSRRTIFNDLEYLRVRGLKIEFSPTDKRFIIEKKATIFSIY